MQSSACTTGGRARGLQTLTSACIPAGWPSAGVVRVPSMAQCALTAVPPSRRLEIAVLVACGVAAALPRIGHRHECPPIVVAEPTHHREHHPARVQRRELAHDVKRDDDSKQPRCRKRKEADGKVVRLGPEHGDRDPQAAELAQKDTHRPLRHGLRRQRRADRAEHNREEVVRVHSPAEDGSAVDARDARRDGGVVDDRVAHHVRARQHICRARTVGRSVATAQPSGMRPPPRSRRRDVQSGRRRRRASGGFGARPRAHI
mmetsp:Transcript_29267/g.75783  ORF Transcript_29267/g.75783 Transcript_29267/m.75783 type:complete len:260 (+) Transcript_29267:439-1218(+)